MKRNNENLQNTQITKMKSNEKQDRHWKLPMDTNNET